MLDTEHANQSKVPWIQCNILGSNAGDFLIFFTLLTRWLLSLFLMIPFGAGGAVVGVVQGKGTNQCSNYQVDQVYHTDLKILSHREEGVGEVGVASLLHTPRLYPCLLVPLEWAASGLHTQPLPAPPSSHHCHAHLQLPLHPLLPPHHQCPPLGGGTWSWTPLDPPPERLGAPQQGPTLGGW